MKIIFPFVFVACCSCGIEKGAPVDDNNSSSSSESKSSRSEPDSPSSETGEEDSSDVLEDKILTTDKNSVAATVQRIDLGNTSSLVGAGNWEELQKLCEDKAESPLPLATLKKLANGSIYACRGVKNGFPARIYDTAFYSEGANYIVYAVLWTYKEKDEEYLGVVTVERSPSTGSEIRTSCTVKNDPLQRKVSIKLSEIAPYMSSKSLCDSWTTKVNFVSPSSHTKVKVTFSDNSMFELSLTKMH